MVMKNPVIRFILSAFSWLLILTGGLFGISSVITSAAALFGGLDISSIGERIAVFVMTLMMTAAFFFVMYCGIRLNRRISGKKRKPQASVSPASAQDRPQTIKRPTVRQEKPQPSADQKRLLELEESIYNLTGAIQVNPMFGGADAYSEEIKRLQAEKKTLLRKMAGDTRKVTVEDAMRTFFPEEQERLREQMDRFSQDIRLDGTMESKAYAANHGLILAEGRFLPAKVARRLAQMREALSDDGERPETSRIEPPVLWSVGKVIYDEPDNPYETIRIYLELGEKRMAVKSYISEHGPDGGQSWRGVFVDAENLKKLRQAVGGDIESFLRAYLRENSSKGLIAFSEFLDEHGITYETKCAF